MDDELRINRIPRYPRKQSDGEARRSDGEVVEEEDEGAPAKSPDEPEVTDGHIDTRVVPLQWGP